MWLCRKLGSGLIGAAVIGLGCGPDGSVSVPEGNGRALAPPLVVGPICADCESFAGGETSDFDGDEDSECSPFWRREAIGLEDAATAGFDVGALHAITDRSYVVSLAWREVTDFILGERHVDVGQAPVGFQPLTSVELSLRLLGDVEHAFLDPELCDAEGYCGSPTQPEAFCRWGDPRGGLSVGAELVLRTADGALDVSVPVRVQSRQWTGFVVHIEGDLSGVSGTLRLAPGRLGPYRGLLGGQLYLRPDAVRGRLRPVIEPVDPGLTDEWWHAPLEARFPAEDDCDVWSVPADPATVEGQALIHQVDELTPRLRQLVEAASAIDVRWASSPSVSSSANGPRTTLRWASTATRASCFSVDRTPGLELAATLRTDDGRLDWATELRGNFRELEPGNSELAFCADHYLRADDPFFTDNLTGVDLFGSQGARVNVCTQVLEAPGGIAASARLNVFAVPACERDPRCTEEDSPCRACGRQHIVARFETPNPPLAPPQEVP